ncbi:MAG: TIGR04084 family radical SAM/SPASM domain-containing protein [Methanomicrobiaceae archaeon]|nr:TIGR04084 family radical SAM/SPASM domain-containing protein [Methanomicrobiaceae archaeon]
MHYFILLTDECNLCCTYCRGKIFSVPDQYYEKSVIDENLPCDLSFDLRNLYDFLSNDNDAVLTFYGGEPLIRSDLIREIMDNAPVKDFIIHTNATLLHTLEPEYINRFKSVFVSIDGDRNLTDMKRGYGTYDLIMKNLKYIRQNGYLNEIIGRMTVTEDTDIFESVKYLSSNSDFSFDALNWQIDSNFWNDLHCRTGFKDWVINSYNPGIERLMDYWTSKMRDEGKVLMWYPFVGTMQDILVKRKKALLRCGSGFENYSILQDGSIAPCPCMAGMKNYYCGHIDSSIPSSLKKISVAGDCLECDINDFCGGRCLYSNITMPWPAEGRKLVYETVKNLKLSVEKKADEVRGMIEEGRISIDSFDYIKYNGCEIIP